MLYSNLATSLFRGARWEQVRKSVRWRIKVVDVLTTGQAQVRSTYQLKIGFPSKAATTSSVQYNYQPLEKSDIE